MLRNGKCRNTLGNVITILYNGSIALIPCFLPLDGIVTYNFTSFCRSAIVVDFWSEDSVTSPIGIDKSIHPGTLIIKGRLHFLTRFSREHSLAYEIIVSKLVCTRDGLFVKSYTYEATVTARRSGFLVEINHIFFGTETLVRIIVHYYFVEISHPVTCIGMWRAQIRNDDE